MVVPRQEEKQYELFIKRRSSSWIWMVKVNLFTFTVNFFTFKVNFTYFVRVNFSLSRWKNSPWRWICSLSPSKSIKNAWATVRFKKLIISRINLEQLGTLNTIWIDLENRQICKFVRFESCGSPNWSCHNDRQRIHFGGWRRVHYYKI